MPAGEYSLRTDNHILYVTSEAQPRLSQIVLTTSATNKGDLPARAVFQRSGDRYYLSQVFAGPQQAAWELPPSGVEREALRGPTIAKVVLRLRVSLGREPVDPLQLRNIDVARFVCATSSSVRAAETKAASNCDGAR